MTKKAAKKAATAVHELDEVVIDAAKKRMVGVAAPLFARIAQAEKRAVRNIAKREAFLESSPDLKQDLRDAFDEGDESAVSKIAEALDKYEASLLRAPKR